VTSWAGTLAIVSLLAGSADDDDDVDAAHDRAIRELGREPVAFVSEALGRHDLLIFDDALHNAREPWDFYVQLLRDPRVRRQLRFVFVEVLPSTEQPAIDAFLASADGDVSRLARAFQDDYSGFGWHYQTCLDLLRAVWDVNRSLPESERLRVVGVNPPIYWEALHRRQDYDLFMDTLAARDFAMYKAILSASDDFHKGKGLFLTNTRHAYVHLRDRAGRLMWNTATFFHEWQPGRTLSLRIHNLTLRVEAQRAGAGRGTAEGMERMQYRWARVEDGRWDAAFARAGNRPVALPLAGNAFGKTPYEGNSMLWTRADQTMADAYDALVFLAPLETLHDSATTAFFFTPSFRQELRRRIEVLEGDRLATFLAEEGAPSVDAFIDRLATPQPTKLNSLVAALPR
jgi:hypothetical protein